MRVHTRDSVSELIFSRWECDLADRVLEAIRPFEGKPITTRMLAKLPALPDGDSWRLRRQYGMTHLETLTYATGTGRHRFSILLAHSEAAVPLDLAYVLEHNPADYRGRFERNHARMEARNDRALLEAVAGAMNDAERAIVALERAQDRLRTLTEVGSPAGPERYELERACGLADVDGRPLINREFKARAPELEPAEAEA